MQNPGHGIRLRGSARSDTGKVRDNNEDRVHLWKHERGLLAVVADGMGGAVAGEEASRLTIETLQANLIDNDMLPQIFVLQDSATITDRMRESIDDANETILHKADSYPELRGMGTTVTMAYVQEHEVIVGHVGDSRAYIVDGQDGTITQVTSDHSFVQALVSAGHISEAEAEEHPMRNVLYRALGQAHDVEIDIYNATLQPGDRLVLCSDGLTLHITPEEIAQVALAANDPEDISRKFIDLANKRGGRDNVSVVVVTAEQNGAFDTQAETGTGYEYTDEDTLIIGSDSRYFGSSESQHSPNVDNTIDQYEHAPFSESAPSQTTMRAHATPGRETAEFPAHVPESTEDDDSTCDCEGDPPGDLAGESRFEAWGEGRDTSRD